MIQVHTVCELLIGDECVHLLLVRHVDQLVCMGQDKAVQVDHHRQHHIRALRELVGLKYHVIGFLRIFHIQLNPAAFQL